MAAIALTFPHTVTTKLANSILLVDDSTVFRGALRREFEEAGWNVWEAADGLAAVEKAEQLQPPLILLDLAMPGMNGLTAARHLKQVLPDARLILLTGYGYLFKSTELSSVGIDAVVSKSEPVADLLVKAQSFLHSHSALKQAQGKVRRQFGAHGMRGTPGRGWEIRSSSATLLLWRDAF
jgi:two-component system, response regulator, stage 0 sporulation protein F